MSSSVCTLYLVLPYGQGDMSPASELDATVKLMLGRRHIEFSSRWFWEDEVDETVYGARVDIRGLDDPEFQRVVGELVLVTARLNGEIRIRVGALQE